LAQQVAHSAVVTVPHLAILSPCNIKDTFAGTVLESQQLKTPQ